MAIKDIEVLAEVLFTKEQTTGLYSGVLGKTRKKSTRLTVK